MRDVKILTWSMFILIYLVENERHVESLRHLLLIKRLLSVWLTENVITRRVTELNLWLLFDKLKLL